MKAELISTVKEGRQFFIHTFVENKDIQAVQAGTADRVMIHRDRRDQTMIGFGGAFTDTSAGALFQMNDKIRKEAVIKYFDREEGIGYNAGRIPIGACDFSRDLYSFCEEEDSTLAGFQVDRDRENIISLIRLAGNVCGTVNDLFLTALPWSPPAWMKTNQSMLQGGHLKKDCYPLMAEYIARFADAYLKEGIRISAVTAQNEPNENQKWPSCIYSAEEEARLLKYLIPKMQNRGIKVLCWDSNKDFLGERVEDLMNCTEIRDGINGAAFHWYSGGFYPELKALHQKYPKLDLFASECCVVMPEDLNDWESGERYGADIMGDLQSGTSLWLDWNIYLDEYSGPKFIENPCAAPIILKKEDQTLVCMSSYYYIGHFSKYIRRGAVRLEMSGLETERRSAGCKETVSGSGTAGRDDITNGTCTECCAFENPDGRIVVVMMNREEQGKEVTFLLDEKSFTVYQPGHSIQTLVIPQAKDL